MVWRGGGRGIGVVFLLGVGFVAASQENITLEVGCEKIFPSSSKTCIVENVDVMPYVLLPGRMPIVGVEDASACQKLCLEDDDCRYFTFYRSKIMPLEAGGTCFLKPGAAATTFPSLFYSESLLDPETFTVESGRGDCSKICDGETSTVELQTGCGVATPFVCRAMSFQAASKGEWTSFDPRCASDGEDHTGCGVGGLTCCRRCEGDAPTKLQDAASKGVCIESKCFTYDVKYIGGELLGASKWRGVRSSSECQTLCLASLGCVYWTYTVMQQMNALGGGCYLYSSATAKERLNNAYGVTAVSGPADCVKGDDLPIYPDANETTPEPGSCFEKNIKYTQVDLAKRWGVQDALTCQEKCREELVCSHFAYKGVDLACHLLDKIGDKTTMPEDEKWESGAAYCPGETRPPIDPSKCVKDGMDSPNFDLVSFKSIDDAQQCRKLCKYDPDCAFIVYRDGVCYFKYRANIQTGEGNVQAGPKLCGDEDAPPGLKACFLPETTSPGDDIAMEIGVKNVRHCQKLCSDNNDCMFFTLRPAEGECYLKRSGNNQVAAPYQVSGPKTCPSRTCSDKTSECELWNKVDADGWLDVRRESAVEAVRRLEEAVVGGNASAVDEASRRALREVDEADRTQPEEKEKKTQTTTTSSKTTELGTVDEDATYGEGEAKAIILHTGGVATWVVPKNATPVDFSAPSKWRGVGLKLRAAEENFFCTIFPEVEAACKNVVKDLILEVSVQVVVVSPGQKFSGWASYNSLTREEEDVFPPYKPEQLLGEFVVYNGLVNAQVSAKEELRLSRPITGSQYPKFWPSSWTKPLDFSKGSANLRFRLVKANAAIKDSVSFEASFCIWGVKDALQCSPLVTLPSIPKMD